MLIPPISGIVFDLGGLPNLWASDLSDNGITVAIYLKFL